MKPWHAQAWRQSDQGATALLEDHSQLTVRFLSETLARVTLKPQAGYREPRTWAIAPVSQGDAPLQGRSRDDLTGFPLPAIKHQVQAGVLQAGTPRLSVRLHPHPLRLEWQAGTGGPDLLCDRGTSAYLREKRTGAIRHCLQRNPAERYYGLGDKTGPLNLHGRRLRTGGMDSLGYDPEHGDPLYKHWPFVLSRTPQGQWLGLYYDTLSTCTFDLGCEHDNYHGFYRYVDIDDGDLDYYLMVGQTPAEVLAQFVALIGGTALPPRWSVGYAQTAMGLADAPDAQAQLDAFIDKARDHRIPVSAFHYGSGYSSRGKQRYVFTWNHQKFPDPKALNEKFHAAGMRLVANIKPCLLDDHPAYALVRDRQWLIENAVTQQPVVEPFWDGQGSHLDFTHPEAYRWWQQQLAEKVLDYGLDAGWNDNNEYAIQDEDASVHGFGEPLPMHRSRPLQALLMTRATYEAQKSRLAPGEPVYTVTRAGPPGIQRYAQTWSGDNTTSWRTLRWNIRTGLQMSLSGMFNVGHDVGGFYGPLPEPELFVRWVQSCCLNPRMVMNSWKEGGASNLPWMHPEVAAEVTDAIRLRYRLMPYLWSLFEQAHASHVPILRPTFFVFPEDEACYEDCDDFMLGDALLAAPVVCHGERERQVYLPQLPQGQPWVDFHDGTLWASGQTHTVAAPLGRLPLFVRSGVQLPLANPRPGQLPQHDDPIAELKRFGP